MNRLGHTKKHEFLLKHVRCKKKLVKVQVDVSMEAKLTK